MLKSLGIFLFVLAIGLNLPAQKKTYASGDLLLRAMHEKFVGGPCRSYSFSQKNTHYRNDSIIKISVWYESIDFPDKFRIDFGDKNKGNFVVFRNDSAINYKNNVYQKARNDSSTLLLILGGMYYRAFSDVLARLKSAGYKTEIISPQQYNNMKVFVIGALENDMISNQVWVDKKTLQVLRIIESRGGEETIDMRFESHQKWCKGYMETKVSFRRNGKLEQVEEYYDIKETNGFPN